MSYGGCCGRHRYRHHHRGRPFRRHWRLFRASLFLTCKFTTNLQLSDYIFYRNTYQNYIYTFFAFSQQLFIIAPRLRRSLPSSPVPLPPPPCDADAPIPATASRTMTYATRPSVPQKAAFHLAKGRFSPRKRPPSGKQKAAFRNNPGSRTCRPGLDPSSS